MAVANLGKMKIQALGLYKSYAAEPVLRGIAFAMEKQDTVSIIGGGSGKKHIPSMPEPP